ncbi:MAG: TetR/AcrR family transcriptional regulator [Desulfobacteraceae bacterium]|nr:TetR/AcrR family transcriptional regulator [Desulfobacteraceae bacterium]
MTREPKTKAALIEAAIKIFEQKGFQHARVSDIVSAAGVAQGTFYIYFRSKEEIFRESCNGFINQIKEMFIQRTKHLFDGDTADEIIRNLYQVVSDIIDIYQKNLAVAGLLFREGIGNGRLFKEIYEDILSIFLSLIEEQIKKAMSKGFMSIEDTEIASVLLFGLFERSLFYFMLIHQKTDISKLKRIIVDFVLKALSFDYNNQCASMPPIS